MTKLVDKTGASHDWRADFTRRLLSVQQADGRWATSFQLEQDPVISTSFAILFLAAQSAR